MFAEGVAPMKELNDDMLTLIRTGGENDSLPRQLGRFIKEHAERHVPYMKVDLIYRRDRYLRGGDHFPFLDAGFAAVRMTEPSEDFRHQHQNVREENGVKFGDLPEFVDFAYTADVARVNAAALASLATGPAAPQDVVMENLFLENNTTFRWKANAEPTVAGYRVLWRETTAPFWQRHEDFFGTCFHGFFKQDFLRRKMIVNRRLGDAGFCSHLIHADVSVSLRHEQLATGIKYLLSLLNRF